MSDDNTQSEGEKALEHLRAAHDAQAKELNAMRAALLRHKSDVAFTTAMANADTYERAAPFGLKLLQKEVANVRLDDDGAVVCDLGELEGISAADAVAAFIKANEFLQPLSADAPTGTPKGAQPVPKKPIEGQPTDSLGNPLPMSEWSESELFAAAGPPPAESFTGSGDRPPGMVPPIKAKPQPTNTSTPEQLANMSMHDLMNAAGAPPK
jgi:hypothetical protein